MIHRIFVICLAFLVVIQPLGCFRQESGPFGGAVYAVLQGRLTDGVIEYGLLPYGIEGKEIIRRTIARYEKGGKSFSSDFGKSLDAQELNQAEILFYLAIGVRKEDGTTGTMDSYVQLFGTGSIDDRDVIENETIFVDRDNDGWPELLWRSNRNKVFVLSSDEIGVGLVDYKTLPK